MQGPRLLGSLTLAIMLLGAAAPAPSSAAKGEIDIRYASSGQNSERVETIPVTENPGAGKRVVASLSAKKIGPLRRGDRLRFSSEIQITTDCAFQSPRCAGDPYDDYDPVLRTRLVLARESFSRGGKGIKPLGPWKSTTCVQRKPHRTHHCVIVNGWDGVRAGRAKSLPCPRRRCHINLLISAHHPSAGPNDRVVAGGNRPDGTIEQDRARVQAYRIRGNGRPSIRSGKRETLRRDVHELDARLRTAISLPIDPVPGALIKARARLRTQITGLPYRVRVGGQLIVARSPKETKPMGYALRGVTLRGEVDERNGFNCTHDVEPCRFDKVGLIRIRDNYRKVGRRRPLYLNFIVQANPKRATARPGDALRLPSGFVQADLIEPG